MKNIKTFCKRFPGARQITLKHNFRSLPPIVENSLQVIINSPDHTPKELWAVRQGRTDVLLVYEDTAGEEAKAVVDLVKRLHAAGKIVRYSDVAILLRSVKNAARPYIDALQAAGIPVHVTGDATFFERGEILDICNLMRFLGQSKPWADCFVRSSLVGLSSRTHRALQDYKGDLMNVASDEEPRFIGIEDEADRRRLLDLLKLKRDVQNKEHSSLLDVLYRLLAITRCVSRFEKDRNKEAILNLGLLSRIAASWDEFGRSRRIRPFLEYLKILMDGGVEPSRPQPACLFPPVSGALQARCDLRL